MGKNSKGHYSARNVGGVSILFSAHHLMVVYFCTKFHENISDEIKVIERTRFSYEKFRRGMTP